MMKLWKTSQWIHPLSSAGIVFSWEFFLCCEYKLCLTEETLRYQIQLFTKSATKLKNSQSLL